MFSSTTLTGITHPVNDIDANELNELGAWQSWNRVRLNAILTHRQNDLAPETLNHCISNRLKNITNETLNAIVLHQLDQLTYESLNNIILHRSHHLTRENLSLIVRDRFSDVDPKPLVTALVNIRLTPNDINYIASLEDNIKKIIYDKISINLDKLPIETVNAFAEQLIQWAETWESRFNEGFLKQALYLNPNNDPYQEQQFVVNLISKTVRKESNRLERSLLEEVYEKFNTRLQPAGRLALENALERNGSQEEKSEGHTSRVRPR